MTAPRHESPREGTLRTRSVPGVVLFGIILAAGLAQGARIPGVASPDLADTTGGSAAPSASETAAAAPASGVKPLYLQDTGHLSRVPPVAANQFLMNGGESVTWTLNPAATLPLTLDAGAGTIPVALWIRGGSQRFVGLTLSTDKGVVGTLGPVGINRRFWGGAPVTFEVPIDDPGALVDVTTMQLTVENLSTARTRHVWIQPLRNGLPSLVELQSLTVINVDSVEFYDAPHPGGTALAEAPSAGTVYVRSVVSDPFGSFDITSAALTLTTPSGVDVVADVAMTEVAADAAGPTKIFETAFPIAPAAWPQPPEFGTWTASVTAEEGLEGVVRHTGSGSLLVVGPPDIVVVMSVQSYSDPVGGTANPFSLPGATMTYTLTASNQGGPGVSTDSVIITNPIPPNTALWAGDLGGSAGPVAFVENSPPSGLAFDPATDLTFSTDGGATYPLTTADLVPDATGADPRVTHLRVNPKGNFAGIGASGSPGFTLLFRVTVQ